MTQVEILEWCRGGNTITGSGGGTWGTITGSINNQSDLKAALDAKELLSNKSTDGALTTNSDLKYPTEKAVKTYVDAHVGGGGVLSWGTITGNLADQVDLKNALDAKVALTRTVNSHPLSADVVVTKGDVGLGSADNTSDLNKPISTATQVQLNFRENVGNKVTAFQVTPDHTHYPSEKLVKDSLNAISPSIVIGRSADLILGSTGVTDLVVGHAFGTWMQRIGLGPGGVPYTRDLTIDNVGPVDGAIFRIRLEFPASANPLVNIYDNTTSGTLLDSINGVADSATVFIFEAYFNGTNWVKYNGQYVT